MNVIDLLAAYRPLESDAEAEWTPAQHAVTRDRILATAASRVDRRLTTVRRRSGWPVRMGVCVVAVAVIATLVANFAATPAHDGRVPLADLTGKPLPALKLVADDVRESNLAPSGAVRTYLFHKLYWRETRSGQKFWYWGDFTETYTGKELVIDYGAPQFLNRADAALVNQVDGPPIPVGRQTITEDFCTTVSCMTVDGAGEQPPDQTYLDSLPADSPVALADALRKGTAKGKVGRLNNCSWLAVGCEANAVLNLLAQPAITASLRATALELLARIPGVTVVGNQTVAGHPGLALGTPVFTQVAGPDSVVISTQTGEILAQSSYNTARLNSPPVDPAFYPPVPIGTATYTVLVVS